MTQQRILFLMPAHVVTRIFPMLRDAGFEVGLAENVKGASAFIRKARPNIIFSRPALSGYRVEDLFAIGEMDPNFPSIVIVTDTAKAKEAEYFLSLGAKDYWSEPLDPEKVMALVKSKKALSSLPANSTLGEKKTSTANKGHPLAPKIIGKHPAIQRVLALCRQVAPSKASVLISGESGTGKELFARTLHVWSDRASGPFVAVNCAALPEHLLESELFGHEKGAFTGAIGRKLGKFELANKGTILLDEISEMELALQAKLLRVLQEGEIDRVGGQDSVNVDVRVLATTNRDLAKYAEEGHFRQDLFFRLNVIPLRLPALRERADDLLELANFFINMYVAEYRLPPTDLSKEAITWLKQHDWPGNVRELQNLMERATLLAAGSSISPKHFLLENEDWPLFIDEAPEETSDSTQKNTENQALTHIEKQAQENEEFATLQNAQSSVKAMPETKDDFFAGAVMPLHEVERLMILKGLEATSGNRTQAAEILGISVRTLRNKLNEYRDLGIDLS